MNIVVVGAGKIGLPLACAFAGNGGAVTITDIRQSIVDNINEGRTPYDEPGLKERVAEEVAAGRLRASMDTAASVAEANAVVIIVSALLTDENDIDYGNLDAASAAVARGLNPGALVSYETTLPVGGCRGHLRPILEKSGLRAGSDFHLVFSPERVKSKEIFEKLGITPKVVGGFDTDSAAAGVRFYSRYLAPEVIDVGTLEAAEFVKLSSMIYRDVNIGLVNELARYAESNGIDFWSVLAAANTDGETAILRPSIGVGGHCTPVYPHFFIRDAARKQGEAEFASLARRVNDRQPAHQVARLETALGGLVGKCVHILGLAFRPGVREEAMSPAFQLCDALTAFGASVTLEDPLYSDAELTAMGFRPVTIGDGASCDAVVLNTAHTQFLSPDFVAWRAAGVVAVLDGQKAWPSDVVTSAGLAYIAVGVPA